MSGFRGAFVGSLVYRCRFRARAAKSIEKACYQEGYILSEGELRLVARIDTRVFDTVAEHLDGDLCRADIR